MTTVSPVPSRLAGISSKAYEHPADQAATAALRSIPMLDTVVRKLVELQYERALRQSLLAGSVRLGPDQLPETWASYEHALAGLDMPESYDLYLTQFPIANAAAIGAGKPMIVVHSELIALVDEGELRTVMGHELGHILSDHVLYRTALLILLRLTGSTRMPVLAGLPLLAVRTALLEWFRAAELSADRAATLVNRDPLVTCRTLMVLAGGTASRRLNIDAFIRQATDYQEWDSTFDRVSRFLTELNLEHSRPVRRVAEIMRWVREGDYERIIGGEYVRRGHPTDVREATSSAVDFYVERFRKMFQDAGAGLAAAGDQLAGAGERLADWIRGA